MTYKADRCLVCEAPALAFRTAITAPFVASRVFGRKAATCRIAQCKSCGFIFFEDRFEVQEAARLYAGYRDEDYFQARHHSEPWYTRKFNSGLGGTGEMIARRAAYAQTLLNGAGSDEIDTVLDFGGDRGQLMLGGPGRKHYVYDISGVEPEAGVVSIADANALGDQVFDLVLLWEVLEHVAEPMQILREVVRHVKPGGLLYITVPNREFPFTDIPPGAWYGAYLGLILKSRWMLMLVDFWSTGFRFKFGRIAPLAFVKMHEHINFFDQNSLVGTLRRVGLDILTCLPSQDRRGLTALCRRQMVGL